MGAITSSKKDDELLTKVSQDVALALKKEYICKIPNTWNIQCGEKNISFNDLKSLMIDREGISRHKAEMYYGLDSNIITDASIIYLTIKENGNILYRPLFLGEMKKQGTNDRRMMEGMKKQAIGNAAGDRMCKNFMIAADLCHLANKDFFPYTLFLHGCDFKEEELTKTTLAKFQPFFGELNKLYPFFDKDITWAPKGGSCFYQGNEYTYEQLYNICYECCKCGIEHFLKKYTI